MVKNEIIKVSIDSSILRALKEISAGTNTPLDKVVGFSYALMIKIYTYPKEERMRIIDKIFK